MPIKFVLVDTNIWHYIYHQPKEEQFVELQEKSRQFMKNILTDASIKIALSSYHQPPPSMDFEGRENTCSPR